MAKSRHSFIEQRSSRSRLNVSLGCFTTLLDAYQIPKQLFNFMCCFGLASGETELSPPPILFRWHLAEANRHFGKNRRSAAPDLTVQSAPISFDSWSSIIVARRIPGRFGNSSCSSASHVQRFGFSLLYQGLCAVSCNRMCRRVLDYHRIHSSSISC